MMSEIQKLTEQLKRVRDEIALKIHLGTKELQEEWLALEKRWFDFDRKARLDESAKELGHALKTLGTELQHAYDNVRKAL
jgi:hypothetical protein